MTDNLTLIVRAVVHAASLAWTAAWPVLLVVAAVWWLHNLAGADR